MLVIGKNLLKHNCLFEKAGYVFQKDNEQFEKRNRLLVHEKPSHAQETVSYGPFATVQMEISNRPGEKMNRAKRKKAGVGAPAFTPIIN